MMKKSVAEVLRDGLVAQTGHVLIGRRVYMGHTATVDVEALAEFVLDAANWGLDTAEVPE